MGRSILFVEGFWVEKFGVLCLVRPLQERGFNVDILYTRNLRRLLKKIRVFQPEFVGFSLTTGDHTFMMKFVREIKRRYPSVKTVVGGPHVSCYPEIALDPDVDLAFRGECDLILPDALEMASAGAPPETIPNLIFPLHKGQANGDGEDGDSQLGYGPLSPVVEDLDRIPVPSREILYRSRFFRNAPFKSFHVMRGCPYTCRFCFNDALRQAYRGKGSFVHRFRSPEAIVDEAVYIKKRYGLKFASFDDDQLTSNRGFPERFFSLWKKKVDVPYNINAMASHLTDYEFVKFLKSTGLHCALFGIETGDEELRTKMLRKPITDEQIIQAGDNLNRLGVLFLTFNMFALPGETFEQALKTIRINRRIKTPFVRATIFQPYPGTFLGDQLGLPYGGYSSYFSDGPIDTPEARQIKKLQKLCVPAIRSKLGEKLSVLGTRIPNSPLHTAVFWSLYLNMARRHMKSGPLHFGELCLRSTTSLF